jgi:hypothetical protein
MKLLGDQREKNYAYNINNSPNSTNKKKMSFNSLEKNFYEDLINSDINIRNYRQSLNEIKSKSIKESIYSNKIVPNTWRSMLGYQNQIFRVIDKDPSFAFYIGRTQKEDNNNKFFEAQKLRSLNETQNTDNKKLPDFIKEYLSKKDDKEISSYESKDKKELSKSSQIDTKKDEDKSNVVNKRFKTKLSQIYQRGSVRDNNLVIDEKIVSSKLDEYRAKYDLNKYMYEIKNKRMGDMKQKTYTKNLIDRDTNYRLYLKTRTHSDKERVLRASIYYNLLSKDDKQESNFPFKSNSLKKRLKPINKSTSSGSFNFKHNNEFDKVIEITNPKIKRDLELINYYGPLYTHCKICHNRNLEFYQNSEPNQTLKLLHFIKRRRLGDENEDKKD